MKEHNHPIIYLIRVISLLFLVFAVRCFAEPSTKPNALIKVPIYHYHNWAPFYFEKDGSRTGFALVFVEQLNEFFRKERPDLKIHFELRTTTRPELNQLLSEGQQGLILWANSLWFKRLFNQPYFESSSPIYWDSEAVISLAAAPVEYSEPVSLLGKKVAGIEGFYYHGVDQLVKQNKIHRMNSDNDRFNIRRLVEGDVDAVLITQTVFNYIKPEFSQYDLYQAFTPQDSYSRHILMTPQYHSLSELLNFYISSLPNNQAWRSVLTSYGLDDLVVPFSLELDELKDFSVE